MAERRVDLFVITPTCEAHSRRNHRRTAYGEVTSLCGIWAALAYVRRAHPGVVIVENVCEPGTVWPLTGLLTRLSGYTVLSDSLDPRLLLGVPVSRKRQFWVLVRDAVG